MSATRIKPEPHTRTTIIKDLEKVCKRSDNMVDYVNINGARLAYRLSGPKDAPLFITLHGGRGMGDHQSDFTAYKPLDDQYRVLSFDYRGHGLSSSTRPYTFEQIVDDVEQVRKHFSRSGGKAIICGGSFGGFLAQHYAIKYADKVRHLILRGTAPSYHRKLFLAACLLSYRLLLSQDQN